LEGYGRGIGLDDGSSGMGITSASRLAMLALVVTRIAGGGIVPMMCATIEVAVQVETKAWFSTNCGEGEGCGFGEKAASAHRPYPGPSQATGRGRSSAVSQSPSAEKICGRPE
jgi:hypothetical protein